MKDTLTIGALAGMAGTVLMHLLSMLWKSLGLIKITTLQVSASILLDWSQVNTTSGYIVGVIVHLVIGAAGGALLSFLIKFTGKDYFWIKGLALTGFMLLVGMGLIVKTLNIAPQMKNDSVTTLMHILNYVVYGLVSSFIIARYGNFHTAKN